MTLKAFKLTHVLYEENDPWGEAVAFLTVSPVLIAFSLGAAFLLTRQVAWAWSLLGALAVDAACSVLKRIIQEPRPLGSYREGPGMPSEHAAFSSQTMESPQIDPFRCFSFAFPLTICFSGASW